MLSGNLAEFPPLRLLETLTGTAGGGLCPSSTPISRAASITEDYPVHAEAGSLRGLGALELLAGIQSAAFCFETEAQTQERSTEPNLETHHLIPRQFRSLEGDLSPRLLAAAAGELPGLELEPTESHTSGLLALADGKCVARP